MDADLPPVERNEYGQGVLDDEDEFPPLELDVESVRDREDDE
jgi:hypothetical protein